MQFSLAFCETPFILFNHRHCSYCLQPKHPDSDTVVAMATSAFVALVSSQLLWESFKDVLLEDFPDHRCGQRGPLLQLVNLRAWSRLPAILPGAAWRHRTCPHYLYQVMSLCTPPSPPFVLKNQAWLDQFPLFQSSDISFGQVTSLTSVTYALKQDLLTPPRRDTS